MLLLVRQIEGKREFNYSQKANLDVTVSNHASAAIDTHTRAQLIPIGISDLPLLWGRWRMSIANLVYVRSAYGYGI